MSKSHGDIPSVSHEVGEVVLYDDDFDQVCRQKFSDAVRDLGMVFENHVTTHSPTWGKVWRADFRMTGTTDDTKRIDRAVCWRRDADMEIFTATFFGQSIEKLK